MKKIFCSFFLILFIFQNAFGQSDSLKKHSTYLGLNILRIGVGDIEIQAMHQVFKQLAVGFAAGYDFNFLKKDFNGDVRNKNEYPKRIREMGEITSRDRRYFYGQGTAFRLYVDFDFWHSRRNQWFISIEGVLKNRNYTNQYFGDGDRLVAYVESGKQTIKGVSTYIGLNKQLRRNFILRTYGGIGVRVLHSRISRPGWTDNENYYYPPTNPGYDVVLPSIHFGIVIMKRF